MAIDSFVKGKPHSCKGDVSLHDGGGDDCMFRTHRWREERKWVGSKGNGSELRIGVVHNQHL